jgi:D-3-phosphoglycerate dehydrogenase
VVAPFVALCSDLGAIAQGLAQGGVDRVEAEFRGRIAEHDTRVLGIAVLAGILRGHTEEQVNLVNASALAEQRGIELTEIKDPAAEDFTELITVRVGQGPDAIEVSGTGVGPRNVPYLVGVWGQSFYMPLAEHLAIFRYADQPGMIGRVGTTFGENGVNIVSAAVGAEASGSEAVMALTTDAPVPQDLIDAIAAQDGFFTGRAIDL